MSKILFSLAQYKDLGERLCARPGMRLGEVNVGRFPNGEINIELNIDVKRQHCFIIGSTAPPDQNLLELLMLAHTLKKDGAKKVTAVLPYAGYSRADKNHLGKSRGAAWLGKLMHAAGIDSVISVDVHSPGTKAVYPMPFKSISVAPLFAETIRKNFKGTVTIVAPDEGSLRRCEAVRRAAGIKMPVAYFKKERRGKKIIHSKLHGHVAGTAIVIDDILDTGGTLVSCCEKLKKEGVKNIVVMVTHGLFSGKDWVKLWRQGGVSKIYCTDTVQLKSKNKGIVQLSIASLLENSLM